MKYRYVIAAEKKVGNDPHFPVRVWVVEADNRLDALRQARELAAEDPRTELLPVRVVEEPAKIEEEAR